MIYTVNKSAHKFQKLGKFLQTSTATTEIIQKAVAGFYTVPDLTTISHLQYIIRFVKLKNI